MKQKNKKTNQISAVVTILMIVLTVYLLMKDNSLSDIMSAVKKAKPVYLVLGIFSMIVFIWAEAVIIYIAMKSLCGRISFRRCMEYSFIGFYFSSITPSSTGGQPAQIYYMNKDNISLSHSSLILLIVTSIYQLTMLLYGILFYFIKYSMISGSMRFIKWLFLFGIVTNGISAFFIFLAIYKRNVVRRIVSFFMKVCTKIKIVKDPEQAAKKAEKHMEEYAAGAEHIKKNPMLIIKTIGLTILQMTAMYSVPYFVYLAFGLKGSSFLDILAVQAVLSLAVSSVPLPGAVGASESGFMVLYKILFTGGMILPAMLLSRGISFYIMLLLSGLVAVFVQFRQNKKRKCRLPLKNKLIL